MFDTGTGGNPFTTTVFKVAAQVGCLTFFIIIAALVIGLFLDRSLETMPLFTILFLVGSMPLSWVMVYWVVNRSKSELSVKLGGISAKKKLAWEDENSDTEK